MSSRHADKLPGQDDLATIAAIGSLAYLSADFAHHALGHGMACLALGGTIRNLSSIFVDCTLTGSTIDLSGPAANIVIGATAVVLVLFLPRLSRRLSLFLLLVAAFNLLWFAMQMVYSVTTRQDDWAWPLNEYGIGPAARVCLIIGGTLAYFLTVRFVGAHLGASSQRHARRIVYLVWLASGAVACLTAAFDRHPLSAIALHAAPQSLMLSIGLLFAPRSVPQPTQLRPIERSPAWIFAAVAFLALSIVFLGPGVPVDLH